MNQTANYNLNQWEPGDKVQRTDFNADNAKIDAALKEETDARTALAARVAKCGNCQIWTTTYTGTGGFGVDHPNRITFPKKPLLVMIYPHGSSQVSWIMPIDGIMAHTYSNRASWSGSTVSWYCYETVHDASFQLNHKGSTYLVIAFIPADQ